MKRVCIVIRECAVFRFDKYSYNVLKLNVKQMKRVRLLSQTDGLCV